jgi:hypothetical protein
MRHHAYYVEGPLSNFEALKEELKPFWAVRFERFGIEDARELIQLAALKQQGSAIFLLAAATLTHEAQQALLKLFEEPQRGVMFVVLIPTGALIGTLRSRMLPYEMKFNSTAKTGRPTQFLKATPAGRSAAIAELLEDEENSREQVRNFLNELEVVLYEKYSLPEVRQALEDIAQIRSYIGDRSPSLKMLLEHLALSLPRM